MTEPRATPSSRPARATARGNGRVAVVLAGLTFGMLGAAFAAVPFYRWFCATTGYGGTPTVATKAPEEALGRSIEVRFDTNVNGGLPWTFTPDVPSVDVRLGETVTVAFRIENRSDKRTRGVATFNVTPPLAAYYFTKLACFCFTEQVLEPGQVIEAPVTFWVDRDLDHDKNVKGLAGLTLSYTFFTAPDAPETAGRAVTSAPKT
ncbi:cytochrome c oxidase assembly protein [Pinisolibacter aquiterrae]|uniref:cytochrome c oxidase assembly protein n=1 Tax=Pinisolibacter aquiterrae TaxID=2815579 RepID=UPI001C3E1109|nr:cytochrome c oxidase assembly protein [Pinisolibacter aquiterrae]MBV5266682.1 cytochrome c oxidase assembly protein [Pinisolibacter aquiterrae]MCC8235005.1 cytochrome c oxidase assembly protein [Pinisolibacter aquiterrae]